MPFYICSTAIAELELTMGLNTPPTDSTNLRVIIQHKSGTASIWRDTLLGNVLFEKEICRTICWFYRGHLHNYGHDEEFPTPSPDGNPFAHIYWLVEENNETTHTTTKINLAPLQNIKDKLKAHMRKHHRLGDAYTNSGYYTY